MERVNLEDELEYISTTLNAVRDRIERAIELASLSIVDHDEEIGKYFIHNGNPSFELLTPMPNGRRFIHPYEHEKVLNEFHDTIQPITALRLAEIDEFIRGVENMRRRFLKITGVKYGSVE